MNDEIKSPVTYIFDYRSNYDDACSDIPFSTDLTKTVRLDEMSTWHQVLKEFANFLSGVYGYDVSSKIFVEDIGYNGRETVAVRDL